MPEDVFVDLARSAGDLAGVFEYDGETGYFYLYRLNSAEGNRIAGAIPILSGKIRISYDDVLLRWDASENKVALFIRSVMWAIFDCRSGEKYGGHYAPNGTPKIPADVTFVTSVH